MKKTLSILAVMALAVVGASTAHAGVRFSIGLPLPPLPAISIGCPAPVYVAPPVVYAQPAPVVVAPPPAVVYPSPVYVAPAPVYVVPRPWFRYYRHCYRRW